MKFIDKLNKYILVACGLVCFSSCEDFLDTTDYLNKNDSNFPQTEEDVSSLLSGVYGSMASNVEYGTFQIGSWISDEQFGGGGMNDMAQHGFTTLLKSSENMAERPWGNIYSGIYNVNKLFETIDKVEFQNESDKNMILGEAHFMRAFFYIELAKLFGDVPLYLSTEVSNIPRTPAEDVYALIASDLKAAIELLPNLSYTEMSKSRLGHATKWAAESFMAREFLFYTGYYKKDSMPLREGGSITKSDVIYYLEDCIKNSGHNLLEDYRSLWFYSNDATGEDYSYNKETGAVWIGEEGDNIETIFAIKFNVNGDWGRVTSSNAVSLSNGLRNVSDLKLSFPFGLGWGFSTVNSRFAENWKNDEPNDIRYKASILDVKDPSEGLLSYDEGSDAAWITNMYAKKYLPVTSWKDSSKKDAWPAACELFSAKNDPYFGNMQDLVLMRFADVLLMHSELTETANGMNEVRKRVGLPPLPYSFENIVKERNHELAFEGVRYYDLLRWYGPEQAGNVIDNNRNGVIVYNAKVPTTINFDMAKRIKETGGFNQIPESQIKLSGGVLKQNPGWEMSDILFSW
jgi:hypothetical protein